jgi:hypothetical protein
VALPNSSSIEMSFFDSMSDWAYFSVHSLQYINCFCNQSALDLHSGSSYISAWFESFTKVSTCFNFILSAFYKSLTRLSHLYFFNYFVNRIIFSLGTGRSSYVRDSILSTRSFNVIYSDSLSSFWCFSSQIFTFSDIWESIW